MNEITETTSNSAAPSREARRMAMFCHLGGLAMFVVPFGNLIVPLVIWLLKREDDPYIDQQGREAVNFQITMLIAAIIVVLLMFVFIGFLLAPLLGIFELVMIILGAIRANDGVDFRYPITIRFIKA
ncbi:MAG: DUF4870 domain-containing protein [Pseudomonadota bacterium]